MDLSLLSSTVATNLISAILVVVTGLYVFLTWKLVGANALQVSEARRQYSESIRPIISINIQIRWSTVIGLKISNFGRLPAKNVRMSLSCDFFQFANHRKESNIRQFSAFRDFIPLIAPGDALYFDFCQGFELDRIVDDINITPSTLDISVSYHNSSEYNEEHAIDFRPYAHTHTPRTERELLEGIEKHLKSISDSIRR